MGSNVTIQNTLSWESAFLEQQPQLINGLEPALSSAQLVLDTILGPPFAWPWNRGILSFTTANQDYTVRPHSVWIPRGRQCHGDGHRRQADGSCG
jgi:hypothetical protein